MTTDLYDTDGVAWSEQQADLLRRLAPTQALPMACPLTLAELLTLD